MKFQRLVFWEKDNSLKNSSICPFSGIKETIHMKFQVLFFFLKKKSSLVSAEVT